MDFVFRTRIDRIPLRIAVFLAALLLGVSGVSAACVDVRDGFEGIALNPANWLKKQLYNNQLEIQQDSVAERLNAVRLHLKPGDKACRGGCQRNEIRIANEKRCRFGDEVWYRFRFRVAGKIPSPGSVRWVIGQWKQESGGSPFLAQRFDNGVFHITVQHNENRILVTKAPGNPNARAGMPDQDGFMMHQKRIQRAAFSGTRTARINLEIDRDPHQIFLFHNGSSAAKPKHSDRYERRDTDVKVELGADPVLPDPARDWVEMIYRVRGGRDGSGLIEVWADGVFKARVTGTIGNDNSAGPTQYFKFGLYRDIHASFGTAHFYFDDFRRSRDKAKVVN